jgi:serine/threonine-protein kinase RsbW
LKGVHFAIDSELSNVSLIAIAVNRICLHLGLDEVSAGELELCISEAATNSIRHAYHGEPGHIVAIELAVQPDQLRIEVSDRGTPMPAEQVHKLQDGGLSLEIQPTDRNSLAEGGRGLRIIRRLMDEVSYSRLGNHNRMIMIKHLIMSQAN